VIAAWMLFSIVTGGALTLAALAADRVAFLSRRPRRFIWLASLVATTFWPVIALTSRARAPRGEFPMTELTATLAGQAHRLGLVEITAPGMDIASRWDSALLIGWGLLSALLGARIGIAIWRLRRLRTSWRLGQIDGMTVQLASDAGPAVVGLRPMRVVLPEWVREMESPLRELVLRHEAEHRAARDPYLLLIATLLTALIPWNVALWLQARRLRLAIEMDCDNRVLRAHPRRREYSLLLLTIAQRQAASTRRLAPALSEPTSNLERRITAMHTPPTRSPSRVVCFSVIAATALAAACAVNAPQSPDRSNAGQLDATRTMPPAQSAKVVYAPGTTFFEYQVENPVVLRESERPKYPAAMKGSGISGEVLAQFVVDETGLVNINTFKPLKSPGPEFSAVVREALLTWRLDPATIGGRKVKQLVQVAFVFRLPDA